MKNKKQTMNYYWSISADYMQNILDSGDRIDLHHTDLNLKHSNPKRYEQFLPEDVIPISRRKHISLHHKNIPLTTQHKQRISKSMKNKRNTDQIIKITFPNGNVDFATNQQSAAFMCNCSKQLISQVLSTTEHFKYFKTAKGCKLEYIDMQDLVIKEGK